MDERHGTPAHSSPDTLRRELMRPADARVPFLLALATALLAGVLGGYILRAATEPVPDAVGGTLIDVHRGETHCRPALSTEVVLAPTRLTAPGANQAE
jgi:hypothetical protein